MLVLDPGHRYGLTVLDGEAGASAELTFVKREGAAYPGNVGKYPGTTIQEVLRALLDRGRYVNNQAPCLETELAIEHIRSALALLEIRAARKRGGYLTPKTLTELELAAPSALDGHVR